MNANSFAFPHVRAWRSLALLFSPRRHPKHEIWCHQFKAGNDEWARFWIHNFSSFSSLLRKSAHRREKLPLSGAVLYSGGITHMIKKHKINVVTREITFAPHYSLIIVIFHASAKMFYCSRQLKLTWGNEIAPMKSRIEFNSMWVKSEVWPDCEVRKSFYSSHRFITNSVQLKLSTFPNHERRKPPNTKNFSLSACSIDVFPSPPPPHFVSSQKDWILMTFQSRFLLSPI